MFTEILVSFFLLLLSLFFIFSIIKTSNSKKSTGTILPKPYPIIGNYLDLVENWHCRVQWTSDIILSSPTATFVLYRLFGDRAIFTGNPENVQHILKSHFHIYQKGHIFRDTLFDFLGNGIFSADGDTWKFQRQVASHEFNTKSLRKFVENVVDTELSQRLIPFLSAAAKNGTVIDFQDIIQRFAFDNICKIAFGYDPAYLLPTLPQAEFAQAFEDCVRIGSERFNSPFWRIKKALNIGSEKQMKKAISQIRNFAANIVKEKKLELQQNSTIESVDLLSRFLSSGHSDETFVTDIVMSFILAGRDTTSVVLTWFFWLLSENPEVETNILKEIDGHAESNMSIFEEVKDMIYTHAALCETMRLYPPVPTDGKLAASDDVLPDGTVVKKGTRVTYHPYAMGRMESIWGKNCDEFTPERWLERDEDNQKWNFKAKDVYSFPVFQAGPRICLGKEMAFLQMKRVVAGVLGRFKVVPAFEDGAEAEFVAYLTMKMKDGLPVRIVERSN